jgi:hypothetical protein
MYGGDLQAADRRHLREEHRAKLTGADETDPHRRTAVHNALSQKPMEVALPVYERWYPVVLPIFGFFVFGVFSG